MSNLLDVIRKNIEFVGISLLLMIIVFVIARASEVLIEKRNGVKFASKNTKGEYPKVCVNLQTDVR